MGAVLPGRRTGLPVTRMPRSNFSAFSSCRCHVSWKGPLDTLHPSTTHRGFSLFRPGGRPDGKEVGAFLLFQPRPSHHHVRSPWPRDTVLQDAKAFIDSREEEAGP